MPRGIKKEKIKKCLVYQEKKNWRVRTDGKDYDWSKVNDDMDIVPINYPSLEIALRECDQKGFTYNVKFATAEE